MTAVNPYTDLLLQCVSNPSIRAIEYSVSYPDGLGQIPQAGDVNVSSKYDYFPYPFSVCTNRDSLLLASCDLVVGLTSWSRSITDLGFVETAFIPDNPEERKYIYISTELDPVFKYVILREPLSNYMGRIPEKAVISSLGDDYDMFVQKNINYQKVAGNADIRQYLSNTPLIRLYITTSTREALDSTTVVAADGVLVYMIENLRSKDILELSKRYSKIYLWSWKLVSPKTCVVCKFPYPTIMEGNAPLVEKFVSNYLAWVASIQVPTGPIPTYPFEHLLNLP